MIFFLMKDIDSVQFIQRLELNIQAEKYEVIRNTFVFV